MAEEPSMMDDPRLVYLVSEVLGQLVGDPKAYLLSRRCEVAREILDGLSMLGVHRTCPQAKQ